MLIYTVEEIMNNPLMFNVVHNDMFSINNMSNREVRESIIHDILMVTMIEKEKNVTLNFGQSQLLRWIKPTQHNYVLTQMNNEEIAGLIENKNGQLRIKYRREILQAAMDYCGYWYDGFEPPEDEKGIFHIRSKDFQLQSEDTDWFNQFYKNVLDKITAELMDLKATAPSSKSLN